MLKKEALIMSKNTVETNLNEIFARLDNYKTMSMEEYKYSFVIVKPNGARHLKPYIREIEKSGIDILGYYVIHDHEKVNLALHTTDWELSHVVPINKWFQDFYGNQGILILVGKNNISYDDFSRLVFDFKWKARHLTETPYVSCVFDRSQILDFSPSQELKVIDETSSEVKKYEMNHSGDFMITLPNSLHSPDGNSASTVAELQVLHNIGAFSIPIYDTTIFEEIEYFNSMEILKKL